MDIFLELVRAFWLMAPAFISNMVPVFVKKIPFLDYPVDFRKTFHGKRIVGENKTFRGFFFGVISGTLTCILQAKIGWEEASVVSYANPFLLGFLLSFGALFGDAVKSFFKRRVNIHPGDSWFFFDQTDYAIGALALASIFYSIPLVTIALALGMSLILHLLIVYLGFMAKVRDKPI